MHTSVRFPSPGQHSDGPLHFLVAMAVPFCPHGAPQAPGTHEDQPASPANKQCTTCIFKKILLTILTVSQDVKMQYKLMCMPKYACFTIIIQLYVFNQDYAQCMPLNLYFTNNVTISSSLGSQGQVLQLSTL